MKANRILIGFGVLVVLAVLAFALLRDDAPAEFRSPLPTIDATTVDGLEIIRPDPDPDDDEDEGDTTKLAKVDGTWRVVSPADAAADARALENAMTKIGEIAILDEASRSKAVHEQMGVQDGRALRIKATKGREVLMDILVGELKGGFTMVRIPGNDVTYRVSGSIKHVFNKATKDWRDKVIFDTAAEDFARIEFHSPSGDFLFTRGDGDWTADGPTKIENYDFHKVSSIVTSIARLRAMDFEDVKSAAECGIGPDSPWLRFALKEGGGTFTLRVGNSVPYNNTERFFVQREGVDQIFVVSKYLADRFRPGPDRFQQTGPRGKALKRDAGAAAEGPRRSDAGPTKLPPDVMQAVEREMEKQKRMKALMERGGAR